MRTLFLVSLVSCAVGAQASFEMMMFRDNSGDFIQRFDPVNRVSLGSFGSGILRNASAICVNQTLNTAYVGETGGIRAFNYFTGELVGSIPVSGMGVFKSMSLAPDGNLMVTDGTNVRKISSSTGATLVTVTPYTNNNVAAAYQRTNGTFMLLTGNQTLAGAYLTYHSSAGAATGFTQIDSGLPIDSSGVYGGLDYRGTDLVITFRHQTNCHTYIGTLGTSSATVSPVTYGQAASRWEVTNPVFTHTNTAFYLQRTLSGTISTVSTVALTPGFPNETYTPLPEPFGSSMSSVSNIAIVLAPEPAPFFVVGLGMVGLLRRRRR